MYWLITNYPWLSFVALSIGYCSMLIMAFLGCSILAEWVKDRRRDKAIRRHMEKVDFIIRHQQHHHN